MGTVAEFIEEFKTPWPDYEENRRVYELMKKHVFRWRDSNTAKKYREAVEEIRILIARATPATELETAETIMYDYPHGIFYVNQWIDDWVADVLERHNAC